MPELTVQLTVKAWHIGTVADKFDEWAELVEWCMNTEGMYCSMAPQVDNQRGLEIQVGGREFATVYPTLDSYVLFNGFQFQVLSTEQYNQTYGQTT
ncbi:MULTISPECIES: hypothetical protein [Mycolicibacterium]|uniref:hypothetical protein n=1 Tax=Mycolicibacterium TaxID=1866885 RepID=UPI001CDCD3B5|nr:MULTISPECIES: hypothetical protein [Mycolicibacterium]MCC9181070.1 hypothetical protein [Mycolicibacterium mageritense]UBV14789.1 hypothetical protein H8Z57_29515 [Mycolicibacterium fortuitum]